MAQSEGAGHNRWDGIEEGKVRILKAATGTEVASLTLNDDVLSVAWSPSGKFLAVGSEDWLARIFEATTLTELSRYAHESSVTSVAWRPSATGTDGSLLTGSKDRTARIWHVFPTAQALIDAVKAQATSCLTKDQRAQFALSLAPPTWCVERRLLPYHGDEWQAWLPKQKVWLASSRQREAPPLPKAQSTTANQSLLCA